MLKHLLYSVLLLSSLFTVAQNTLIMEMDSIQDEEQATKFIEDHKVNKGTIYVFNKEKHKTLLAQELFKMGKGGSKTIASEVEKTHYKVIDKYNVPYYRVSYVYLDGTNKTKEEIHNWGQNVMTKYQQGYKFKDLAKQYSMGTNANQGGDSGWFIKDTKDSEFEDAVINSSSSVGDLFTVHTSKDKHYVVLRTHNQKIIEEIKVLTVTEPIK